MTTGFDRDMEVAVLDVVIAQWGCTGDILEVAIRLTAWEDEYAVTGGAEVAGAEAVAEADGAAEVTGSEMPEVVIWDWVWAWWSCRPDLEVVACGRSYPMGFRRTTQVGQLRTKRAISSLGTLDRTRETMSQHRRMEKDNGEVIGLELEGGRVGRPKDSQSETCEKRDPVTPGGITWAREEGREERGEKAQGESASRDRANR
ncbi:MAG: hypothetical protein M1813_003504 [Trichoglossum hirsutum]|nr:MAG: hypothetical protein M1813_003504 [Trichoglossum hirsutum]